MKRLSVSLPDELYAALRCERLRRGVPAAAVVREALGAYLEEVGGPRRIPFAALGNSGSSDTGRRIREMLREMWR